MKKKLWYEIKTQYITWIETQIGSPAELMDKGKLTKQQLIIEKWTHIN